MTNFSLQATMDQPLLCQVMFGRTVFSKAFNSYLVYRAALLFEEIVFLLWNRLKRNYEVIAKSFLKQKYFQRYRNVFIVECSISIQLMVT